MSKTSIDNNINFSAQNPSHQEINKSNILHNTQLNKQQPRTNQTLNEFQCQQDGEIQPIDINQKYKVSEGINKIQLEDHRGLRENVDDQFVKIQLDNKFRQKNNTNQFQRSINANIQSMILPQNSVHHCTKNCNQTFQNKPKTQQDEITNKNQRSGSQPTLSQQQAHSLLKFILQRNNRRIVSHKINQISPQTILYKTKKQPQIKLNFNYNNQKQLSYNNQSQNKSQLLQNQSLQQNIQAKQKLRKQQVHGKKLNQVYTKIKNQFRNLYQLKKKYQFEPNNKSQSSKNVFQTIKHKQNDRYSNIDEQLPAKLNADSLMANQYHRNGQDLEGRMRGKRSISSISQKKLNLNQNKFRSLNSFSREKKTRTNSMISVSALSTYKFKSIKAQKSLVYNKLLNRSSQQLLQDKISSILHTSECAIQRANKIKYQSSSLQKVRQKNQKQIAFKQSLSKQQNHKISIDKYLQKVIRDKISISKIYGEEYNKIDYINYLMFHEHFSRQLAEYSVNFIIEKIKAQQQNLSSKSYQNEKNNSLDNIHPYPIILNSDDLQLKNRKKVCYYYKPKKLNLNLRNDKGDKDKINKDKITAKIQKDAIKRIKNLSSHNIAKNYVRNSSGILLNHLTFLNQY